MTDKSRQKTVLQRQQLWAEAWIAAYNANTKYNANPVREADDAAEHAVNSFDEFFKYRVSD